MTVLNCRKLGEKLGNGCNRLGSSEFFKSPIPAESGHIDRIGTTKWGKRAGKKGLQRSKTLDLHPLPNSFPRFRQLGTIICFL
jgi:hypothetical protein